MEQAGGYLMRTAARRALTRARLKCWAGALGRPSGTAAEGHSRGRSALSCWA